MTAGKIRHWKHGWKPVTPWAQAYKLGLTKEKPNSNSLNPPDNGSGWRPATKRGLGRVSTLKRDESSGITAMIMMGDTNRDFGMKNREFGPDFREPSTKLAFAAGLPFPVRTSTFFEGKEEELKQALTINQKTGDLMNSLHNGGFTYNPRTGGLVNVGDVQGVAVAVPHAEQAIPANVSREEFFKQMLPFVDKYSEVLARGGFIGGWHSEERDSYMIELTELVENREEAVRLGRDRNQEAVFDLGTGELIDTGGTGDSPPKIKVENALNQSTSDMVRHAAEMFGTNSPQYRRALVMGAKKRKK